MKIYVNKFFKISANPDRVSEKSPTSHLFIEGKKKDKTPFMIRVAAIWQSPQGIKGAMIENNTNPKTGVEYSGYGIVKNHDIKKAEDYIEYLENVLKNNRIPFDNAYEQKLPPVEQMQMNFGDL